MVSIDEAEAMLEELVEEIPREYFIELNGGVNLSPECKLSPAAVREDLYTMGQYIKSSHLGRIVVIYYGSFAKVYENGSAELWRRKLSDTLRHELTHHLESLAGERDLELEDARKIAGYLKRNT